MAQRNPLVAVTKPVSVPYIAGGSIIQRGEMNGDVAAVAGKSKSRRNEYNAIYIRNNIRTKNSSIVT